MEHQETTTSRNILDKPFGMWLLRHRRPLVVFSQLTLVVFSYILSFLLRFEFDLSVHDNWPLHTLLKTLPLILLLRLGAFYLWDLNRGWWRYVSMNDLMDIIKAVISSSLVFITLVMFVFRADYPRSVFLIDTFICITFLGGIRFLIRAFREWSRLPPRGSTRSVLIYGAREIGVEILREIRANAHLRMNVVGFIDDYLPKKGFKIHGVPVLGGREELARALQRYSIDEVIITTPSIKAKELGELIERFQNSDVRFRMVPAMSDILGGKVSIKQLRDVEVEDLLGRQEVSLDMEMIREAFTGRRILITGAGGSIGSEIARQCARLFPSRLVLLDRNENSMFYIHWELSKHFPTIPVVPVVGDAGNPVLVEQVLGSERPDIILHAAAYKHVPLMESNAVAAVLNNVRATQVLTTAAARHEVDKFVLISTDKAVRPQNVMGRTKRLAEWVTLGQARKQERTKFLAVRFGNVLASQGSVIPLFRRQIAAGGPVTITHPEMMRFFMTIPEAVQLVMQAAAMGQGGEIFVLEMGEQIRILDLARNLILLSGFEPERDIEIVFTGLRPGEKLREELWDDAEGIGPTAHNKIQVVRKVREVGPEFHDELVKLIRTAEQGLEEPTRQALATLAGADGGNGDRGKNTKPVDEK